MSTSLEMVERCHGNVPCDPIELTLDDKERCQELTLQLLDRTLRSYDERDATTYGTLRSHSNLDNARWKRHMTRDNVSLYSERDHGGQRDLHMPGEHWANPAVVLAVGTIRASLDDVMFGITTQTFEDLRIRAASIGSHEISGATLAKISGPTELDPFQNLSISWMIGEQGWPLNLVIRPRDFLVLMASGIITRANGDRIGYDIIQPAPALPQLAGFPNLKPLTRGKVMYGALFKEQQDGTVDVYIQFYVEAMGYIADTLTMSALWTAILGFWEAPRLAMEKKLQWCILHRIQGGRKHLERVESAMVFCGLCKDKVRRFRDGLFHCHNTCAVCSLLLCSSCRVKRSFKVLNDRRKRPWTKSVHVVVCQHCLDFVTRKSATEIARQQHQERLIESISATAESNRSTWDLGNNDAITFVWSPRQFFSVSDMNDSFSDHNERKST